MKRRRRKTRPTDLLLKAIIEIVELKKTIRRVEKHMVTRDELNVGLLTLQGKITELFAEMRAAFQRLEEKIAAGQDFTNELDALNETTTAVQAALDEAKTKGL